MHWEPRDRLGVSLKPSNSAHRNGFDRHPMRPNNLFQLVAWGYTLSVFWPRRPE